MATTKQKPTNHRKTQEKLETLRRRLMLLSDEWIGEGATIEGRAYRNRRGLTEPELTWARVICRAGHEIDRILREEA